MCQLGLHSHLSLENIFQSHSELAKFTDLQIRNWWKQVFLGQMALYFILLLAIRWFVYIVIKIYAYVCYENVTDNLPRDKLFMMLIADLSNIFISYTLFFKSTHWTVTKWLPQSMPLWSPRTQHCSWISDFDPLVTSCSILLILVISSIIHTILQHWES